MGDPGSWCDGVGRRATVGAAIMARRGELSGYFDGNATTPMLPAALEAWMAAARGAWRNPSSLYRGAATVRRALEDAREVVADRLGCVPGRVVFGSGATEANHAVFEWCARRAGSGERVVISGVEHPSVRESAHRWFGRERTIELPHAGGGGFDREALERVLAGGDVALVSVMAANNETGELLDWEAAAAMARRFGVRFHCDAVQWIGKLPASRLAAECDFVVASAHKFGGPKGAGFVLLPGGRGDGCSDFGQAGGRQEGGHRGGTENHPSIVALVAALEARSGGFGDDLAGGVGVRAAWRNAFEERLLARIPGTRVMGAGGSRLWNTSMVVLPRHANLKWLTRLDERGFEVSTGSACSAGPGNPSHVMASMGLEPEAMGRVIRVSSTWETAEADWTALGEAFGECWEMLERGARAGRRIDLADLHPGDI